MKKKNEIRGNLFIQMPQPFHRQQLSLSSQKKDKQIRLKLQQLHQKRNEHQQLRQQWQKQKQDFSQFVKYHQTKDASLKLKEQSMRKQLFKLQIRKQQIESKTNLVIMEQKVKKLVQYLKCIPYTLGNYYEKVVLWKGEQYFLKYKFLFNYCMDKVLLRTQAQKQIRKNLSKIVHCSKLKFQGEWLMMSLKRNSDQSQVESSLRNTQRSFKCSLNDTFELSVYAITGKYFCLKKNYSFEQLQFWASSLQKKQKQRRKLKQLKHEEETRRISMAEMLANNSLKELATVFLNENAPKIEADSDNDSSKMELQTMLLPKGLEPKTIQEENESQANSNRQSGMNVWTQNSVEATNNALQSINDQNSDSNLQREQQNSSNDSSEQVQKTTEKQSLSTKKRVKSKSFFFSQTKYGQKRFKSLNKVFMQGIEEYLFPGENPLLNIVILKAKKQIYILQNYLQIKEKLQLINIAVARCRLKMKMKKQLKKCLYYKVMRVQEFYQTRMKFKDNISLPILFVIKKVDLPSKEIRLSCTALEHNHHVVNGLSFSHLFYKQRAQKTQTKDNRRISNNKLIKSSGRRSKDFKRRTISKSFLKGTFDYQKSSFHISKKESENAQYFTQYIKQKFEQFMKENIIWATKKCFISNQEVKNLEIKLKKIQTYFRKKKQMIKYSSLRKQKEFKVKYFPDYKVLLSFSADPFHQSIRICLERLQIERKHAVYYNYTLKYKKVLQDIFYGFVSNGQPEFQQLKLQSDIKQAIHKQDKQEAVQLKRKPEKQRAAFINFFRMIILKRKTKNSTFCIKKIQIKQKVFVLIIRRDARIKSLLQCNFYELPKGKHGNAQTKPNKDTLSENGWPIQSSMQSNKQLNQMPYNRYQRIFLQQQYFDGIPKKNIPDQFFIDYKIFLLKPTKQPSIYYIERLCPFDINCEEVNKQIANLDKDKDKEKYSSAIKHSTKLTRVPTNKEIVNPSNFSQIKKENTNHLAVEKDKKMYNGSHYEPRKSKKKQSLLSYVKHSLIRQHAPQHSVVDSKSKQSYKISGNSHNSIIYYSLYKSKDIFFYLDLYIVTKKRFSKESLKSAGKGIQQNAPQNEQQQYKKYRYSEQIQKISSQRLYKKQLQDWGNLLITKKIAYWLNENEEKIMQINDSKDKNEQTQNKIDLLEGGLQMCEKVFQLIDNCSKRFSQNIPINLQNIVQKERNSRTNTRNF